LSFNNIEVIEGLDTLVKLQDLSLYNNRISKIEHMDTLQELQIFSIGKNNLTTLENVSAPWLWNCSLSKDQIFQIWCLPLHPFEEKFFLRISFPLKPKLWCR